MFNTFSILVALIFTTQSHAQIPLARLPFRQQFQNNEFAFDLGKLAASGGRTGGEIRSATVENFPALSGEGISYTLVNMDPCAINLPHVHPRATELLFVITGKALNVGFVEENGGRTILNTLSDGQVVNSVLFFFSFKGFKVFFDP